MKLQLGEISKVVKELHVLPFVLEASPNQKEHTFSEVVQNLTTGRCCL